MYKKYISVIAFKEELLAQVAEINHHIETWENGKELVKTPKKMIITNLGESINTPYSDYSPVVSINVS
jgi:hypothetical protein